MICIESITSLCWGGSSRAAVPGVCLALVQGSCSLKSSTEGREGGRERGSPSCCICHLSDFNSRGTRFAFGCSGVLRGDVCVCGGE